MFSFPSFVEDINSYVFYANDRTGPTYGWQTFNVPADASFISITCIGAGGGGGGGGAVAVGTSRGGAVGGASGSISTVVYPTLIIPQTIFIQVGAGGAGGAANTAGSPGSNTVVTHTSQTNSDVTFRLCHALGGAGGGGTAGTASGTMAARTAAATIANVPQATSAISVGLYQGALQYNTGQNNAGSNFVPDEPGLRGCILSYGGHGGGMGTASGAFSAGQSLYGLDETIVSGGKTEGAAGGSGVWSWKPMYGLGGGGGASQATAGAGGNGGNGAFGCGGGASGAGRTVGSTGGRGGDGLVLISCW